MSFIVHRMCIYIYIYILIFFTYKIETHSQNIENRLVLAKVGEKRERLGLGVWGY